MPHPKADQKKQHKPDKVRSGKKIEVYSWVALPFRISVKTNYAVKDLLK